ncbi:ABC transporter substrate-binding protein [Specibacter sp. RAF43]|uniref:ABC transporter substrate-binding protein n=1 Tax=Specibacter sp. RAF43 TaxID=3233057 RepID=UPI003F9A55A7
MRKMPKAVWAGMVGLSFLLTACGGPAQSASNDNQPIKIGAVLSLTGPAAAFGIPERNAAQVAVDKVNAEGGIKGRQLELVVADDKTNPTEAARAAQRLISSQGVVAIVGSSTGSGTLAMAPVAAQNKVPVLAPNGTIGVTDPAQSFFPWVFRTSVSDTVTIPALLERAKKDGHRKIAVFYQEDALGRFSAELLQKMDAKDDQFEIVSAAAVPLEATDVSAQATKIREAKPDAVILPLSSVGVGGSFLRTTHELGLNVPMYGALAVAQDAIIKNAGEEASKRLIVANMINPSAPTVEQQKLYDLIRKAGNEPAGGFADLFGANSIAVAAAALKEASTVSGEGLRDALENGKEYVAWAIQPYRYSADNHDGLASNALVWTTVDRGKFVSAD